MAAHPTFATRSEYSIAVLLKGIKIRAGLCELHIGAALVFPKPAAINRELETRAVFGRRAVQLG
jgi:hypothetical protein